MAKIQKPVVEATLILAYDAEDKMEPQSIFLFHAIHKPGINVKDQLAKAFWDFSQTEEGKKFIEDEGVNWGDATYIPVEFLAKRDIYSYEVASRRKGDDYHWCHKGYRHQLVVDHNEALLEKV